MKSKNTIKKIDSRYSKGFTLLETIVAIGVITTGFVSALALITNSYFYISNIQNRLVAANLAAEGIELVRNIRDNNWLQSQAWNLGLNEGDYQVAYDSASLSPYSGNPLLLDANGIYNYASGTSTSPYVRKISIAAISNYQMRVTSAVTWKRGVITYNNSVEEYLFDWK